MSFTQSTRRWARAARIVATAAAVAVIASGMPVVTEPAFAAACTITGTDGNDVLQGTEGDDFICGGNGNDTIYGGGGNDQVYGGGGDDIIFGGDGDDTIYGEGGNDSLHGQAGNDALTGSNGMDKIDGGEGDDTIDGGNDSDTLQGGAGNDFIDGALGADVLDGGPGGDQLFGGNGDDTIYGGFGSDAQTGGRGNDKLYGGPGNDNLNGVSGDNECDGGTGTNAFASCSTTVDPGGPDPAGEWADTDNDDLFDAIELRAGTDPLKADTDGDGLTDGAELMTVTDPLKIDTDDNGITDSADDPDSDGLTTGDEIARGTKPGDPDSDGDTLGDGEEAGLGTDPLKGDTDGDGLADAEERELGSDPLVADADGDGVADGQELFSKDLTLDTPAATFHAVGTGKAVLAVELYVPDDARLVEVPGQRGPPVGVDAPLPLDSGNLTIPFEGSTADDNIAILHFNEETATFDLPATQAIDHTSSTATVTTADFSPFVVVDLDTFADAWKYEITTPGDGASGGSELDLVLTMDTSADAGIADPDGARFAAAKTLVATLDDNDRAAIVDADVNITLFPPSRLPLTGDKAVVTSTLDQLDSVGFTNLSWAMTRSLNEIDRNSSRFSSEQYPDVVVHFTSLPWYTRHEYGGSSQLLRVQSRGTTVFVIVLGTATTVQNLQAFAEASGGGLYYLDNLGDLVDHIDGMGSLPGAPGAADADGDGLADVTETSGWRDGAGRVFFTDPDLADTDGDGLSDGDEAGRLRSGGAFGKGTYYTPVSHPTRQDTDGDNLGDLYEVANGLMAWNADYDRDGLNDAVETQVHSTEPWLDDGDVDGYSDAWEIAHQNEGFDPLLYDQTTTILDYIGDFTRGTLCGDIEDDFFCKPTNLAFLIGNIASGVIVIGDIRDALAGIARLDFVSAGLSVAALIPLGGDALAGIKKYDKFIKAADEVPSGAALRSAMKDVSKTIADRMALLAKVSPNAVTKLKAADVRPEDIVRLASRMISAKHFDDMVSAAKDIKKAPQTYRLEKDAETFLRSVVDDALPTQILSKSKDGSVKRFFDVLILDAGIALEVKHGRGFGAGRAANQVANDRKLLDDPTTGVREVSWQFFTNNNNTLGPDQRLLDLLAANNLEFVLWVA